MKTQRSIWLFVAMVVIVPITVYAAVHWFEQKYDPLPVLGEKDHAAGSFNFVDQDGKSFSGQAWKNKIIVANFFFTHCASICPKMMYQLKRVQAYGGNDIMISSFSVDPERDSAAQLQRYADLLAIKGNWKLITGDKRELYRFARNDLMITATDGDGGPNDFIHSENLVLIDANQRIRGFYKGTDEAEVNRLIKDIEKLRNESK
jgi:protein SCO1/2